MTCLALVPTVLLVYYCTGVCVSQESDLVVLTTASRLREEIRSQLNEAELRTCQPQNCTSLHEDLLDKIEERVTDSVKEVKDLLSQLFHLLIPGYTFSHPASSCKEIIQLAPQSPSGLYWIRVTGVTLNRMMYFHLMNMYKTAKGCYSNEMSGLNV